MAKVEPLRLKSEIFAETVGEENLFFFFPLELLSCQNMNVELEMAICPIHEGATA